MPFSLFGKKKAAPEAREAARGIPAIRCSICTGEQVAGFRNRETGHFEEVMLLRSPEDLDRFRKKYGIEGEIAKFY